MRVIRHLAVFALSVAAAGVVHAGQLANTPPTTVLVGSTFEYQVVRGDSLSLLSARFGVGTRYLARINRLGSKAIIRPGDRLIIDTRHIAQLDPTAPLTLNLAQRLLFLRGHDRLHAYPVAVGRSHWQTPTGRFTIVDKETNPTWDVPESIQEEMRRLGGPVQTKVLPGPDNPLGEYFIRLSFPSVGLHGTNAPSSIYGFATHGCIRLSPADVAEVFDHVTVGMQGVSIYEPVLMTVLDGRVWLEVHPDVYRRSGSPRLRAELLANMLRVTDVTDMALVDRAVREQLGTAVDVTKDDH